MTSPERSSGPRAERPGLLPALALGLLIAGIVLMHSVGVGHTSGHGRLPMAHHVAGPPLLAGHVRDAHAGVPSDDLAGMPSVHHVGMPSGDQLAASHPLETAGSHTAPVAADRVASGGSAGSTAVASAVPSDEPGAGGSAAAVCLAVLPLLGALALLAAAVSRRRTRPLPTRRGAPLVRWLLGRAPPDHLVPSLSRLCVLRT